MYSFLSKRNIGLLFSFFIFSLPMVTFGYDIHIDKKSETKRERYYRIIKNNRIVKFVNAEIFGRGSLAVGGFVGCGIMCKYLKKELGKVFKKNEDQYQNAKYIAMHSLYLILSGYIFCDNSIRIVQLYKRADEKNKQKIIPRVLLAVGSAIWFGMTCRSAKNLYTYFSKFVETSYAKDALMKFKKWEIMYVACSLPISGYIFYNSVKEIIRLKNNVSEEDTEIENAIEA